MPKKILARILDYKKVFNSPAGARVLHDLMREGCMLDGTYNPEHPNSIYINEGKRNLVLHILSKLNTDVKILEDQIRKEIENERRNAVEYNDTRADSY